MEPSILGISRTSTFIKYLFLVLIVLSGISVTSDDTLIVMKFPGRVIGNIDKSGFPEPSGIVYHPIRKTLFVVGDEGDLCEMKTGGTLLRKIHFPSGSFRMDFEGITVNPLTGLLYVAVEGAEAILEIDPTDLAIKRQFDIERTLDGELLMAPGGQGIEGIAFMPNPEHPHGGTFLLANQAFDLNNPKDISAIFEVDVPLNGNSGASHACKLLRRFSLDVTDLSDLYYDVADNTLYVISDLNNLLFLARPFGVVFAKYTNLPCADQEGIAIDDTGNIYIAQDSGGIVKIKWTDEQRTAQTSKAFDCKYRALKRLTPMGLSARFTGLYSVRRHSPCSPRY